MNTINILSLLTLRKDLATVETCDSLLQTLRKFQHYHYTAMPLIDSEGRYVSTISEGDLLYALTDGKDQNTPVGEVICKNTNPAMQVGTPLKEICMSALDHNFIPMVDDRNVLMGIITRKALLSMLSTKVNWDDQNSGDFRRS